MTSHSCPFCNLPAGRIVKTSETVLAIYDGYPVSKGHSLVIPRRHIASWFDATDAEQKDVFRLLAELKNEIDSTSMPAGYNIGINDGAAAGQTIAHLHVHLIPRYLGEPADPRGGVRWILPQHADYWTKKA
jgi:diadenosine tetraphosphate (Ap4A) HIT family hydrolase